MVKLLICLPQEERTAFKTKARSHGMTTSAYIRRAVKDSMNRPLDTKHAEVLTAIRALMPALIETLGRTQKVSRETIEQMTKTILDCYDQFISKRYISPVPTQGNKDKPDEPN